MYKKDFIIDVIDVEDVSKTRMENVLYNLQRSAISANKIFQTEDDNDLIDEEDDSRVKTSTDVIILLNVN